MLTVVAAALGGTLAATYPLFLGRSLVSPGNGPTALLYDQPPFVFGSSDLQGEAVRGVDVGAMMWAILPYTVVQREAIAQGEFPLWNRYNSNGQPLWGQGQTFILDPFHVASLAITDAALAMDVRFIVGRMLFAAGAGLSGLLVTASLPAATLVAVTAPFVGHFTSRFNHPAYFSVVYAPWILVAFAWLAIAEDGAAKRRATLLLVVATWLQLVGSTPKEGIVTLVAAFGTGLLSVLWQPGPWATRLGQLDRVVAAGAVAVLLAAPHWLVFLDTLSRAWTAYSAATVQLAGTAQGTAYLLGAAAAGQPFTGGHPLLFAGVVCALIHPRVLWRHPIGMAALAAGGTLVALAFGILPTGWLTAVPLMRNIHHVWDAFLAATIPLVLVVASVGLAEAARVMAGPRVGTVGAVLTAALLGVWVMPASSGELGGTLGMLAVAGAVLVVVTLACVRARAPRWPLLTLGTTAAVFTGGLHLETGIRDLDAHLLQPRNRARLEAPSPAVSALTAATAEPSRVAPLDTVFFPGAQAYWHVEAIGGPDALRLPQMDFLADLGGLGTPVWQWRLLVLPHTLSGAAPFLDLLNVRFLVARRDQLPPGLPAVPMTADDQLRVVERPTAWPRAFFVSGVGRHVGAEGFADRFRRAGGPFASVEAREDDAAGAVQHLPERGDARAATDYVLTTNTTSFRVVSSGPGLAVLSESYVAEDFQATLNGRAVRYLRVNHGFKGVVIPGPGEWTVRFTYRPRLWGWSWLLAAAGLLGAVWLGRWSHTSSTERQDGSPVDNTRS